MVLAMFGRNMSDKRMSVVCGLYIGCMLFSSV